MVDLIAPAPGGGVTSPFLIQSQQNDPRVMLARAMLASSQNDNTPLYSPFSALAKALQGGLAGAANVELGQEYQQRQKDLGDTMAQALKAGQTGLPGWTNPDTGQQAVAPTAPGFEALAQTLMQSPDPAAQQMGMQYGMQGLTTTQAARLKFMQDLADKGLTLDGTGQVVPLPNYGQAIGGIKQAESQGTAQGQANVDLQMKPQIAAATVNATAQPEANAAALKINTTAQPEANAAAAKVNATAQPEANAAGLKKAAEMPYQIVAGKPGSVVGTPGQLGITPSAPAPSGGGSTGGGTAQPQANAAPHPFQVPVEPNEYGKKLADQTAASDDAVNAAKGGNARIAQMMNQLPNANLGTGAHWWTEAKNFLNTYTGMDFSKSVTADQVFDKLATQFAADATAALGKGEAASVFNQMRQAFPNREMTPDTLKEMMANFRGLNDYLMAQNAARHDYIATHGGTSDGFTNSPWMQHNSPQDFINDRVSEAAKPGFGNFRETLTPTPAAIDHLKKNPDLAGAYDRMYGYGASRQVLGQ